MRWYSASVKDFATLLILIVISGGGYATYRYASLPTSIDMRRLETTRKLPATICTFKHNSFESAVDGTIWIYKGNIRIDSIDRQGAHVQTAHSLITEKNEVYTWKDGSSLGERAPFVKPDSANTFVGYPEISCEPWWMPNASIVAPPALVDFAEKR